MRRLFLLLIVPLALLAAACGGGGGSSSGSVAKEDAAVVDGTPITRAQLDRRLFQARCSYDAQKRAASKSKSAKPPPAFPKAGSQEYQVLQSQYLQLLVQQTELAKEAPKLGVSVSAKQVDDRLTQLKKQYFGGSEKRYRANLKTTCFTDGEARNDIRAQLVSEGIYKKLTGKVKVSDGETEAYYATHRQVYTEPQTRVVRHILVKSKSLADKLYAQVKHGGNFAALAKKYSVDPGSKSQGGRLTISKGQTVPEFDQIAFALRTGEISKPVHSQFGWHIIQALKPTTPRQSTPFAKVKETIRQQLLQQKRTAATNSWVEGVKQRYTTKITYATGLAPATTTAASPTTTG
jgi:foldase protein PrsA